MKSKVLFLALYCISSICFAEEQKLKIWHADGTVRTISLTENPATTFQNDKLVISTSKSTISIPLDQVRKYTFELGQTDGVDEKVSESVSFSHNAESIKFRNLKSGSKISLWSSSGILIKQIEAGDGETTVSVSDLPDGTYIVNANGITYKIIK